MTRAVPDVINTPRLLVEPLAVDHATEMVSVLASSELYRYTGGSPPTVEELKRLYEFQVSGSPRGGEWWLNWVIRADGDACGYVQATVIERVADIAWVVGIGWQGRGYAKEAAAGMVDWLARNGVASLSADIHPQHVASQRVAAALGLEPTDEFIEGERRWVGGAKA